MPRNYYNLLLKELRNQVAYLANMIETAIQGAIDAMVEQDVEKAEMICRGDDMIDDQMHMIERQCFSLLLRQQPVAKDLREVSAALEMIRDMERIGDHAEDISELTILMAGTSYPDTIGTVEKMAQKVISMLKESVDAYLNENSKKAEWVIEEDDAADTMFDAIKGSIAELIRTGTSDAEQALDILMTAKYLERIGDHATNIAEWALYSMTGELPNSKKEEE
ncbi:MAG: phosphate signaling complex protein PhoU [Lachnospiraceae bacterium]